MRIEISFKWLNALGFKADSSSRLFMTLLVLLRNAVGTSHRWMCLVKDLRPVVEEAKLRN